MRTSTFTLRSYTGRLLCATSANGSFVIEIKTAGFSETSVPIYKVTRRHAPPDRNINAVSFILLIVYLEKAVCDSRPLAMNGWLNDELE